MLPNAIGEENAELRITGASSGLLEKLTCDAPMLRPPTLSSSTATKTPPTCRSGTKCGAKTSVPQPTPGALALQSRTDITVPLAQSVGGAASAAMGASVNPNITNPDAEISSDVLILGFLPDTNDV